MSLSLTPGPDEATVSGKSCNTWVYNNNKKSADNKLSLMRPAPEVPSMLLPWGAWISDTVYILY